jgi:hypothetical protein
MAFQQDFLIFNSYTLSSPCEILPCGQELKNEINPLIRKLKIFHAE